MFRGCLTGHECVFSNSFICPIYIPEVDCKCRAGCRVDYTFIPYGATVTMDTCGNTCSCFNMYGAVSSCIRIPKQINRIDITALRNTISVRHDYMVLVFDCVFYILAGHLFQEILHGYYPEIPVYRFNAGSGYPGNQIVAITDTDVA